PSRRLSWTPSQVYAGGRRSQGHKLRFISYDLRKQTGCFLRAGLIYQGPSAMKLSRTKKLSWKLLLVYTAVVVLLYFADKRVDKWTLWNFWVGLGFLAASCWLRIWASGHLVKNKVLTVTG